MLRNDLYVPWFKEDLWGVEIIRDHFKDTVIQINKIEFSKVEESSVDLDYTVIHKPFTVSDEDTSSVIFSETMSLIINDVLQEAIKIDKDAQDRINSTQESGQ